SCGRFCSMTYRPSGSTTPTSRLKWRPICWSTTSRSWVSCFSEDGSRSRRGRRSFASICYSRGKKMPIPESQLETWSHQGSITQSSSTYNTIKSVLEDSATPYAGRNFKVFLQGSYGNDTNIYAESDVDIVIRLDDC